MPTLVTRFRSVAEDNGVDLSRALAVECARELGLTGSLRHRCPACGGVSHGRPLIYLGNVSLSRAPEMVVAAVTDGPPIGVDIERVDAVAPAMARRIVSRLDAETDLTRLWVAKEAAAKMLGFGLRLDFRQLAVDATSVRWFDRTGFAGALPDLRATLTWLAAPDGYLAALVESTEGR